jgi:hypothetical protein
MFLIPLANSRWEIVEIQKLGWTVMPRGTERRLSMLVQM